jgi:hypothetical protein
MVDLTNDGMGELCGWYSGSSNGWIAKYSQQRFVDDFGDLEKWVFRRFGKPEDRQGESSGDTIP